LGQALTSFAPAEKALVDSVEDAAAAGRSLRSTCPSICTQKQRSSEAAISKAVPDRT
jgi:hypothetical protein